jgi:hypothetical protein
MCALLHLRHVIVGLILLALTCACDTVAYYDMQAFTDPAMELDDGATETHWFQKVHYSVEGSAGGIGTGAGGGCGCY